MNTPTGPDPIDVAVGTRIRVQRRHMKISQDELAQVLGLTFQQVQKYERGKNRISASKLFEASRALGVQPGWFFEGLDWSAEPGAAIAIDSINQLAVATHGPALSAAILQLSETDRSTLLTLARRMAGAPDQLAAA